MGVPLLVIGADKTHHRWTTERNGGLTLSWVLGTDGKSQFGNGLMVPSLRPMKTHQYASKAGYKAAVALQVVGVQHICLADPQFDCMGKNWIVQTIVFKFLDGQCGSCGNGRDLRKRLF